MTIEKKCLWCESSFIIAPKQNKKKKFCNSTCANRHKGNQILLESKVNRICVKCKKLKSGTDFSYIKKTPSLGRRDTCKTCGKKEYHQKFLMKSWKDDAKKILLYNSKKRAKNSNLEWNLTREDLIIPSHCPVFGFELKREDKKTWRTAPSIDRVDNTKGYTPDNIIIISRRANILKKDATIEELEQMAEFFRKFKK